MQVEDGLSCGLATIDDHSVALVETICLGNLVRHQDQVPKQLLVLFSSLRKLRNALSWNHQDVARRLRIDVPKGHAVLVLVDRVTWNLTLEDLGEEVVRIVVQVSQGN